MIPDLRQCGAAVGRAAGAAARCSAAASVAITNSTKMPRNHASFGRRKIRFSTGIGRVKSPRRERPSSDAFAGSFGLGIEVVFDRLTSPLSQEAPPIPWHATDVRPICDERKAAIRSLRSSLERCGGLR